MYFGGSCVILIGWLQVLQALQVRNDTATKTPLNLAASKEVPKFMELGPFGTLVEACKYCFTSNTKSSVVPNCKCVAYNADDGPTMFCTASQAGLSYALDKTGGCVCNAKNMAEMGSVTCDTA